MKAIQTRNSVFQRYDPRQGRRLSILAEDGTLKEDTGDLPRLSDGQALSAYRLMVLARQADEWAVSLNRQGRMPTYPLNKGQEANPVGALLGVQQDDWFVPSFRELGGWLARGIPLDKIYLYWYGNEVGSHLPRDSFHTLPISIPVGSQPLHAVGIAYAEKVQRTQRIAITFMGEGATSEGAVHEALNLAGVWQVGVLFYVQNNQWAISLPTEKQTATTTVAEKAFAYGFEGMQVDGNDLFAVYAAVHLAAQAAREQRKPFLIEGYTYRLGAHTTADDPKRYRDEQEVALWTTRDPLVRLEKYFLDQDLLVQSDIDRIRNETLQEAREAFERVEQEQEPHLEDTFRHTFHTMPRALQQQLERRRQQ